MTLYDQEWHFRRPIMEAALNLLCDREKRTARGIFDALPRRIDWATSAILMSVLDNEGRRYVQKSGVVYEIKNSIWDPEFTVFELDWTLRRLVMENALGVLRDGKRRKAVGIVHAHARDKDRRVKSSEKSLVNSVLFSEAKRYVVYDEFSNKYEIRGDVEVSWAGETEKSNIDQLLADLMENF